MNEPENSDLDVRDEHDDSTPADIPVHMKPEELEKLRDYGKDMIPPGVA